MLASELASAVERDVLGGTQVLLQGLMYDVEFRVLLPSFKCLASRLQPRSRAFLGFSIRVSSWR